MAGADHGSRRRAIAAIVLVWAAVYAIRMAAPSDLADNDQPKPLAYASDIIANGAWILQRDAYGRVTSKPPLHAWLIAIVSTPTGVVSRVTASLPSALAMLGVAVGAGCLLLRAGRPRLAVLAGIATLLSPMGVKMVLLVRTDSLFTATVFLAFAIGVIGGEQTTSRARARWRVWFWLATSVATLTKGPMALVFVLPSLLVRKPIEAPDANARRSILLAHALSAVAVPLLAGGWFLAAIFVGGREVWDVMVGRELVAQALYSNLDPDLSIVGRLLQCLEPPAYFLTWFAPWSVLAAVGIWRVLAKRTTEPTLLSLQKALTWQILLVLVVLMGASHKRSDHLAPLIPAVAILAVLELAPLVERIEARRAVLVTAALLVAALLGVGIEHFGRRDDRPVRQTWALDAMGDALRRRGIAAEDVAFVAVGILPQLPIGAKEPQVPFKDLPQAISSGRRYVVTLDPHRARDMTPARDFIEMDAFGEKDVRVYLLAVRE